MPEQRVAESLPAPSAEMVLFRVFMQSVLGEFPRKRGVRILRGMKRRLSLARELSSVIPIRPAAQLSAVMRARIEADVIFDAYLPFLEEALPDE